MGSPFFMKAKIETRRSKLAALLTMKMHEAPWRAVAAATAFRTPKCLRHGYFHDNGAAESLVGTR
jgi:hypothetical protein